VVAPTQSDVGRRVSYHHKPHPFHGWTGVVERITEPHCYVRWDNGQAFHVMHCLLRWAA
jgi:hypothetical protein